MAAVQPYWGRPIKFDRKVFHSVNQHPKFVPVGHVDTYGSQTPNVIVLHDTESHDYKGIRDIVGIVSYFQNTKYPSSDGGTYTLAAHYIVDSSGYIASIADVNRITYHDGVNVGHVGIEQIGFAKFNLRNWKSRRKQLRAVAKVCAHLCHVHGIPTELSVQSGICTHAMVSKAYPDKTDHTDPGSNYPLNGVLHLTKNFVQHGGWYDYYRGNKHVW